MAKVLFSTWRGERIDNRGKEPEAWEESAFKLPENYD